MSRRQRFTREECGDVEPNATLRGIAAHAFQLNAALRSVELEENPPGKVGCVVMRPRPHVEGVAGEKLRETIQSAAGIRLLLESDN